MGAWCKVWGSCGALRKCEALCRRTLTGPCMLLMAKRLEGRASPRPTGAAPRRYGTRLGKSASAQSHAGALQPPSRDRRLRSPSCPRHVPWGSYYRGAAGALLVYDIASRETFNNFDYLRDKWGGEVCGARHARPPFMSMVGFQTPFNLPGAPVSLFKLNEDRRKRIGGHVGCVICDSSQEHEFTPNMSKRT